MRGGFKIKIIIFSTVYTTLQHLTILLLPIITIETPAIDFALPTNPVIIEGILLKLLLYLLLHSRVVSKGLFEKSTRRDGWSEWSLKKIKDSFRN